MPPQQFPTPAPSPRKRRPSPPPTPTAPLSLTAASHQPPAPDPVSQIVAILLSAAAERGFTVTSLSLQPGLSSHPTWPSVQINGAQHLPAPYPLWPAPAPNQPPYHIHPSSPYPQYYPPPQPAYFQAPPNPAALPATPVPHGPPNVYWSTVMPNPALVGHASQSISGPVRDGASDPSMHDFASHQAGRAFPPAVPKEYVCPRCHATFKTNSNMQKHVRTVHENCRPFKCDKCDASYGHKNLLVEHKRTAHDGERPFVCETCGARFGRSSNLYSHMKSHDGKREHQCKTCHVSFSLHGNMVKHYKTVHLKQRPFLCEVCSSRFGLRSDLMRHVSFSGEKQYVSDQAFYHFYRLY